MKSLVDLLASTQVVGDSSPSGRTDAFLLEQAVTVDLKEDACRPKSTKGDSAESRHFRLSALSKRGRSPVGQSRHFALQRKRRRHRSDFLPWCVLSGWSSLCIKRNGSGFQFLSKILEPSRFSGNPPEAIIAWDSRRFRCRTRSTSGSTHVAARGDIDGPYGRRRLTELLLERPVRSRSTA